MATVSPKAIRLAALWVGVVLVLAGLLLVGAYLAGVVQIIIDRPPDRSWLFWGLGLAMPGMVLLVSGVVLTLVARRMKLQSESEAERLPGQRAD